MVIHTLFSKSIVSVWNTCTRTELLKSFFWLRAKSVKKADLRAASNFMEGGWLVYESSTLKGIKAFFTWKCQGLSSIYFELSKISTMKDIALKNCCANISIAIVARNIESSRIKMSHRKTIKETSMWLHTKYYSSSIHTNRKTIYDDDSSSTF